MSFLNYLISGVSLGSVYAIIALGYTMVYGIAKMLNFAHGDVIMVGAYVVFFATSGAGVPAIPAVLLSMVVCTVLGVVIEKVAYKPLRKRLLLSGGADYRHRRQLPAAEPGASDLRIQHKILHLRQSSAAFSIWREASW